MCSTAPRALTPFPGGPHRLNLCALWLAGLDRKTGLCCPVGLRDLLADSFEKADKLLLDELRGTLQA